MRHLAAVLLLIGAAISLGGCVIAPPPGYYDRPYGYGPPHHHPSPGYYRPYW